VRFRAADGSWIRFEARGWSGLHDPRVDGVVLVLRRLDDRDGWTVTGGDARRHAAVLSHAPSVTLLVDSHGRLEGANRAFTATLGRPLDQTLGHYLTDLVAPGDRDRVRSDFEDLLVRGGTRGFEAALIAADGRDPVPFWLTAVNLLDDRDVRAVVVSGAEIAPLVAARQELAHRITHDPLTGLANRELLLERLEAALQQSLGTTARVGLIIADVDDLGAINERHGRPVGDAVLVQITRRLAETAPGDVVSRLGGDQFALLAVRDSVAEVEDLVEGLIGAVADLPEPHPGVGTVTISAGCAVARYGARADDLLRRAERAMYHRRRGRTGPEG